MSASVSRDRRRFLQFLAASPLLAGGWAQQNTVKVDTAADVLSLMDFEEAARRVLPPAHWGYMASGVDDDATIKANREGFTRFRLRPAPARGRQPDRSQDGSVRHGLGDAAVPVSGRRPEDVPSATARSRSRAPRPRRTRCRFSRRRRLRLWRRSSRLGAPRRGISCTCPCSGKARNVSSGESRPRDVLCWCGRLICSAAAISRRRSDPVASTPATAPLAMRRREAAVRSMRCRCSAASPAA